MSGDIAGLRGSAEAGITADKANQVLKGQILSYNLSPKGIPEGIILKSDDGTIQVNFDSELAGQVTQLAKEGDAVVIDARPDADRHADAVHPVFTLIRLSTGSNDNAALVTKGEAETDITVRGKIICLNHARRGEINGAILDSGEFIHLRPHGVKAIGGISLGNMLEAQGDVRSGWSGHKVIEASSANGIQIGKPPHKLQGPDNHKYPDHKQGGALSKRL